MRPSLLVVRLGAALLAAFAVGCAASQNYLAPDGPRLLGAYAGKPAEDPTLRIVTFNVEYGKRVDAAIEGLRSHPSLRGADVLLLQEMDGPGVDQIALALGMNFVYFPASREPKGQTDRGNAILSPWPIEEPRKILLPHQSRIIHRARVAVTALLTIDGRLVRVYCVHLGSPIGISGGRRRAQAEVVLADAERSAGPTIIAGDFNSHGIGDAFVDHGYIWATRSVGKTVGLFSFDHVFVRGLPARVTAGVAREVNNASDHRPVWAALDLQ
jgi:endonuclease/exonuclease/phosphatase family metal-dependent hydrolase